MNHLSILPMSADDIKTARGIAVLLGYADSTAYTSTSDIAGLYCLPIAKGQPEKVVVKTAEHGFIALQFFVD